MSARPIMRPLWCLVFALAAVSAWAHPHVFITNRMKLEFEGQVLARIDFEWTFDDLFSGMIIADYDKAGKGQFTDSEAAAIKRAAFDNLRNYHYFVALSIDGRPLALPPIQDFRPSISKGRLVYSFKLPLNIAVGAAGRKVGAVIYDDTYYVAFDKMSPADVVIDGGQGLSCSVSIEKTKVKAAWPGQFMPDEVVAHLKGHRP